MPKLTRSIVRPLIALGLFIGLMSTPPDAVAAKGRVTQTFSELGPVKVGERIPTWAGYSPSGQMIRGEEIIKPRRGPAPKGVVISFFGTWCQPCRAGLRIIQNVMDENPDYKTVLIAKPPQLNRIKPFLKGLGVKQLVVSDTHDKIAKRLGVEEAVPRTIVVGPDGKVRAIFGEEGGDFKECILKALKGK